MRRCISLLLVVLVGCTALHPALGQDKRQGGVFYGKVGAGISDYTGDLPLSTETAFFDLREFTRGSGYPYIFSGEAGYQSTPEVGVAVAVQGGNHPVLRSAGSSLSNSHLLSVQLLGRYTFEARTWTVAPYLDGGANITFGGNPDTPGIGPVLGVGLDMKLNRTTSFFVESRLNATYPDDAIDGADLFEGPFDVVGQMIGWGVRVDVSDAPMAPTIHSVEGPDDVQAGESATFTARVNTEEAARPLSYRWQFGDGETGTGLTTSHVFEEAGAHTVTFTVRNDVGQASRSVRVRVTEPTRAPDVLALDGPSTLEVGESAVFSARVNQGQATRPVSYEWDFGDGEESSGLRAAHTFYEQGKYEVKFTARNETGVVTRSMSVTVTRDGPLPARIASVRANPNPAAVGESVHFQSVVQGVAPVEYDWHFDDGTTAEGPSPVHTFEEPGRYEVRLEASNEIGEDTEYVTVRVSGRRATSNAGIWGIVVASLTDPVRAEDVADEYRDRLGSRALPVRVVGGGGGRTARYRVTVGCFQSARDARKARKQYSRLLPPDAWLFRLSK